MRARPPRGRSRRTCSRARAAARHPTDHPSSGRARSASAGVPVAGDRIVARVPDRSPWPVAVQPSARRHTGIARSVHTVRAWGTSERTLPRAAGASTAISGGTRRGCVDGGPGIHRHRPRGRRHARRRGRQRIPAGALPTAGRRPHLARAGGGRRRRRLSECPAVLQVQAGSGADPTTSPRARDGTGSHLGEAARPVPSCGRTRPRQPDREDSWMARAPQFRRVRPPPAASSLAMRIATLTALRALGGSPPEGERSPIRGQGARRCDRIVRRSTRKPSRGTAAGDRLSGLGAAARAPGDESLPVRRHGRCVLGRAGADALRRAGRPGVGERRPRRAQRWERRRTGSQEARTDRPDECARGRSVVQPAPGPACDAAGAARRTVFGEGRETAEVMTGRRADRAT